jgi:hypothetical protein
MRKQVFVIAVFLVCLGLPCAYAQDEGGNQGLKLRKNTGYVSLVAGGINTDVKNGSNFGIAGGADLGIGRRLGIQVDGGALYGIVYEDAGFGFISPAVSIHPLNWKNRKADLYILGGYTLLGNSFHAHNLLCVGGGINYWRTGTSRVGLRIEFRDHIGNGSEFLYNASGAIHLWQIRIGAAIR